MKLCIKCGKENEEDNVFCVYCGCGLKEQFNLVEQEENETNVTEQSYEKSKQEYAVSEEIPAHTEDIGTNQVYKRRHQGIKMGIIVLIFICLGIGIGYGTYYFLTHQPQVELYVESYEPSNILLCNLTQWDESIGRDYDGCGELYYQSLDGEKHLIAQHAKYNSCVVGEETDSIVYLDSEGAVYLFTYDGQPVKISEGISNYGVSFTEDEKAVLFYNEENIQYLYNIAERKLVQLEGKNNIYFNAEGNLYYYIDNDQNFYRQGKELEEKIAEGVENFRVLENNYYLCEITDKGSTLILGQGEKLKEEKIGENLDLEDIQYIPEEQLLFYAGEMEYTTYSRSIYIKLPSQEAIKIADNVLEYEYHPELRQLYYSTSDYQLFRVDIPKINKKAKEEQEYFKKMMQDWEPKLMDEECTWFKLSPDGKKLIVYDKNNAISLLKGNVKSKLADNVNQIEIFNDYIFYVTNANEIFIQDGIEMKTDPLEKPICLGKSENLTIGFSKYGKYLSYYLTDEQGKTSLVRYDRNQNAKTILEDVNEYDYVSYMGNEHLKKLKYEEIKGNYYCAELECLFKLEDNRQFNVYYRGEQQGSITPEYTDCSRYSLYMDLDQANFEIQIDPNDYYSSIDLLVDGCWISVLPDKSCQIYISEEVIYNLVPITEEEFNQKLKEQQVAEEERRKAEEEARRQEEVRRQEELRRQALESTAQSYLYNGAYISEGSYIYNSPDYGDSTQYYTNSGGNWEVRDYYINYDDSIIWVEVYYHPSYYYDGRYGWFPIVQ